MSEQSVGGDLHPAFNSTAAPAAQSATSTPSPQPAAPERTRGHSPARDWRQAQQQQPANGQGGQGQGDQGQVAGPQTIKIGDFEYSADEVNDALRLKSEQDVRARSLPQSADGYEIKLPANFELPHDVRWEFDHNSPELKNFQRLAHARGLDQEVFAEALGIYAANRIGEQQALATARNAELTKLGSAADARINAIETWLKAKIGAKAAGTVAQLRNYPVASMVEMFEGIIRQFSNQGGATPPGNGRSEEQPQAGKIQGYENMNFSQKRAAQDAMAGRPVHGPRASGGR